MRNTRIFHFNGDFGSSLQTHNLLPCMGNISWSFSTSCFTPLKPQHFDWLMRPGSLPPPSRRWQSSSAPSKRCNIGRLMLSEEFEYVINPYWTKKTWKYLRIWVLKNRWSNTHDTHPAFLGSVTWRVRSRDRGWIWPWLAVQRPGGMGPKLWFAIGLPSFLEEWTIDFFGFYGDEHQCMDLSHFDVTARLLYLFCWPIIWIVGASIYHGQSQC